VHIPDGYLSPATCAAFCATATPFWLIAAARVRKMLSGRTVPLLAIFSAFSFTIMMFNVPVPGGTTAHGVGGTLTAIVLGPWAAVISTSVALVIQALFFGDGGILSIGANCFNMGIVLPFVGYFTYRMIAGKSDGLSQRRVVAAAIGSYVGISVAALCVGLELGLQPHIASTNGVPNYSPYGFSTAIPAMLASHMGGASFVEAAITALSVAYMQSSFPELLTRGKRVTDEVAAAAGKAFNPWIPALGFLALSLVGIFTVGMIGGHGHIDNFMGLDWTTVNWTDAGETVLVSVVASVLVLPVVYLLLRNWTGQGVRTIMLLFVGLILWAPIGLIAPGGAFAEDQPATQANVDAALQAKARGDSSLFDALPDVNQHCSCVPADIGYVGYSSHALLAGYEPPWVSNTDPNWQKNIGYQVAALAGMALLGGIGLALYRFARWLQPAAPPDWRTA
jgi:cobalt/nickel transport system permease protein